MHASTAAEHTPRETPHAKAQMGTLQDAPTDATRSASGTAACRASTTARRPLSYPAIASHRLKGTLLVGLMLGLAGCQSVSTSTPFANQPDPLDSAPAIQKGLDADSLNQLLSAELAGQRGDYPRAADGYLAASRRFDDPELARRAVLAARYADNPALLERAAERWQQLDDTASEPSIIRARLAMERGDWMTALEQRLVVEASGGNGNLATLMEQAIDAGADLEPLLSLLTRHITQYPTQPMPKIAAALLDASLGNESSARARLSRLEASHADLPELWLARSEIERDAGHLNASRQAATRGLDIAPDDSRLVLSAAQTELASGDMPSARERIDTLVTRHPNAPRLRMALASLFLDADAPQDAHRLLLPLLEEDPVPDAAFAMLGLAAEASGEIDNAILYYRQVPDGERYISSRARAAQLLAEHDRIDEARQFLAVERLRHPRHAMTLLSFEIDLLDTHEAFADADTLLDSSISTRRKALTKAVASKDNDARNAVGSELGSLLFLRGIRRLEDSQLEGMESDLREVIALEPDNASAYNALGYTLLVETDRRDEALTLIERAHELSPDDSAILDSLGWGYYLTGDNERALSPLEAAWAQQQDAEIGAHLIEVLWSLDRQDEARSLSVELSERFEEATELEALFQRIPALRPVVDAP
ncbi:tetratricopeptide repeat protein [Cobetia sp. L2A1]|uniref:tetratricopeptide repeat protein n=1 Tax=Cobetia sp. L2A1 TaxID=2686360 RepID=UPI00131AEF7E|nr:tetratricopeptide repeat protein [Cobetia sp. L2A1]